MEKVHTAPDQAAPTQEETLALLEATQAELAATKKKLATAERQRDRAQTKAEKAQHLQIEAYRELNNTKREVERYKRENTSLKQKLDNAATAMGKMAEELEDCKGLCKAQDKKIQKIFKDLAREKERAERLRKFGTSTAKRAEKLEACVSELKDQKQAMKAEFKKMKKAHGDTVGQVQTLVRNMDKTTRKLHRLQVSQSKDFTNSGIPSSRCPNKPVNTREPTGRKPGAQDHHEFHGRKKFEGDCVETIDLPVPEKFLNPKRYVPTEEYKEHQRVGIRWVPHCTAVRARGFLNLRTKTVEFPPFPPGYYNDVSYDGALKALLFELIQRCNVSVGHARQFLLDITDNKVDVSTGCICGLAHEFASKTKGERDKIFNAIASSRVVQGDFTFGRLNGKQVAILISATPDGDVLFQAKPKKGLAGLEGSPLQYDPAEDEEDSLSDKVVVSDHESAFARHCGNLHQECLAHVFRSLVEIHQQEPTLEWSSQMSDWIKRAIHFRNQVLRCEEEYTAEAVDELMDSFHSILEVGKKEYASFPNGRPKVGYNKGVNLLKRLREHPGEYTLFLYDLTVPPTNSLCELMARLFKRKANQVMTFRSMGGVVDWCDSESAILKILAEGLDLYVTMASIFDEPVFEGCSTKRKPRGLNKCHMKAIREAMKPDAETAGNSDADCAAVPNPQASEATA